MSDRKVRRFRITFRDGNDPEIFSATWRGYDWEHAEMRFLDSCSYEGWEDAVIVKITEIK